jgi:hypothetical protein
MATAYDDHIILGRKPHGSVSGGKELGWQSIEGRPWAGPPIVGERSLVGNLNR